MSTRGDDQLIDEAREAPIDTPFEATDRVRGGLGVRDNVLVVPSVICSHITADRIAAEIDGAVSLPHDHGCAQIGDDHEQTERSLLNLTQNPNVAGATVVGLGCEHLQSGPFARRIRKQNVPVREVAIQAAGGSDACQREGIQRTKELVNASTTGGRRSTTLSELTIGVVSSDLADSTRDAADPLVGAAVDRLLNAGARVVVAGSERLAPHADKVIERAKQSKVAAALQEAANHHADRPGNVREVARRSAEFDFDTVVGTWGSAPVDEFVPYGGRASVTDGLVVTDAPSRFAEAATALAAAGASIIIHVTAEGIPTGHPVVPVVKVTADDATAEVLEDDIDVNARHATPTELLKVLYQTADGVPTAAERHGLTQFAIGRSGPSQ